MKEYITMIAIAIVSLAFSGCSVWDLKYGKEKPKITYSYLTDNSKRDGIHAWNPDTSAAVSMTKYLKDGQGSLINNEDDENITYFYEQKTCVMSAAAIKARDSEGGLTINVTPPSGTDTGVNLGAVTRELQKITMLQNKNEAATFLDVAFFGICMASMNDSINKTEVKSLMDTAITNAAAIANGVEQPEVKVKSSGSDSGTSISSVVLDTPVQNPADSSTVNLGLSNEVKAEE